ncbi:MAG: hypothetical protein ACI8UD_002488 [Planctomycetota bacterium]
MAEWGSDGPNRSLNYLHPDGGSGGGCRVAVGEWSAKGVGFRAKCPGGWLGNRSVDGVTAGCDCGVVGFGRSEPQLVFPMPGDNGGIAYCSGRLACHEREASPHLERQRHKIALLIVSLLYGAPTHSEAAIATINATPPLIIVATDDEDEIPPADAVCEDYPSNSLLTCARLTATCAAGDCKVKTTSPVTCTCAP